jgi:hypothetical protein
MKKLLLICLTLPLFSSFAKDSTCKYEYTDMAREIFIKDVCSVVKAPKWNGSLFSKSYNIVEGMIEKYCGENIPQPLCKDDIVEDGVLVVEEALKFIQKDQDLSAIANFESVYQATIDYMNKSTGAAQLDLLINRATRWGGGTDGMILSGPRIHEPMSLEAIEKCNEKIRPWDEVTCVGKIQHFQDNIYHQVRLLMNQLQLLYVGKCLEATGFGKCPYKMFKAN